MLNNFFRVVLVIAVFAGLLACSSSSNKSGGNGIYAYIAAIANGDGNTNVSALMLNGPRGSGGVVDISHGDLIANANLSGGGVITEVMAKVIQLLSQDFYEIENLFVDDALDTEFEVVYTTAPSSTVFLPMGFSFTGPTTFTWNDANFDLAWVNDAAYSPALGDATFTIYYQIDCPSASNQPRFTISDDTLDLVTSFQIDMSVIEGSVIGSLDTLNDTCTVEIELERSVEGNLDPNYTGGSITGIQTRTQTYTITP